MMLLLSVLAAISVAGAVYGASLNAAGEQQLVVNLTAGVFVIAALIGAGGWTLRDATPDGVTLTRQQAARSGAEWFALVFLWGAAVMGLGYWLNTLYWQHWWQYAGTLLILWGISTAIARRLAGAPLSPRTLDVLAGLTAAQGIAACVGLTFLVGSGKAISPKPDWLANVVFMMGGAMIAVGSGLFAYQQWRMRKSAASLG